MKSKQQKIDQIIEDHRCCLDQLMEEYGVVTESGLRRALREDIK